MKTKDARALAKSLLVDIDGTIASAAAEDRHSAAASAAILATRLISGMAVNLARIAHALEVIADNTTSLAEHVESPEEEDSDS